jgi:uncharacterized membrane protein YbhN (UPF0104 family)
MVVSTAVTVAVLVVVFVGIFPQVADYSQAWSSIRHMPTAYLVALVVATVANSAAYVWRCRRPCPAGRVTAARRRQRVTRRSQSG